jgi:CBS domain-containing membrane protein
VTLVPALTDGRLHAVVVTAPDRSVLGIVTQTDMLATLARAAVAQALLPPRA